VPVLALLDFTVDFANHSALTKASPVEPGFLLVKLLEFQG